MKPKKYNPADEYNKNKERYNYLTDLINPSELELDEIFELKELILEFEMSY